MRNLWTKTFSVTPEFGLALSLHDFRFVKSLGVFLMFIK